MTHLGLTGVKEVETVQEGKRGALWKLTLSISCCRRRSSLLTVCSARQKGTQIVMGAKKGMMAAEKKAE